MQENFGLILRTLAVVKNKSPSVSGFVFIFGALGSPGLRNAQPDCKSSQAAKAKKL